MNKEQIIKYLKNSIDEKGNYCYSLPIETTKAIIKYIDQLTNNWNELEEYLNEQIQRSWEIEEQCYEAIYDKMEEIKEGKK